MKSQHKMNNWMMIKNKERTNIRHSDSDSDLCINDNDDYRSGSGSALNNNIGTLDSRVRRSSNGRVSIRLVSDEQSTILATYKNVNHWDELSGKSDNKKNQIKHILTLQTKTANWIESNWWIVSRSTFRMQN